MSTRRERKLRRGLRGCSKCGKQESHYVPGGFGIPGFYLCTQRVLRGEVVSIEEFEAAEAERCADDHVDSIAYGIWALQNPGGQPPSDTSIGE